MGHNDVVKGKTMNGKWSRQYPQMRRFVILSIAFGLLVGCGGGSSGGDGGGTPAASPVVSNLVDMAVANLPYTTSSNPGTRLLTGSAGQFQCLPGETVTFYYGPTNNFIIGNPIPCPSTPTTVTTVFLLGASSVTDPSVNNLAQLLMTLDNKTNPTALTIPNPLPGGYNPANVPSFSTANTTTFNTGLQTAFPNTTTVTTPQQAATQLAASLNALTVTIVNTGTVTSTPGGITCPGACSFVFQAGTTVTLTATGAGFQGWSTNTGSANCGGTGTCAITLTTDSAVTATFPVAPPPATLTINPNPGNGTGQVQCSVGGGAFGACASSYPNPTAVTLRGVANSGSTFSGFSNGTGSITCTGTADCPVNLTANSSVTATFTLNAAQLSMTATPFSGNGGVGTALCSVGGGAAATCGTYPAGTQISIIPSSSNANFTGWTNGNGSGLTANCGGATGPCTFQLTSNTTIQANFSRPTLTVQVNGTGSVSSNPMGINNCTTNCSAPFDKGTTVTLTASGAGFGGWTGGGCSGTGTCIVPLTQDISVTASFGGITGSAFYHFFSGGALNSLMAVDPAAPAATPITVATSVANPLSLSTVGINSFSWDASTTSLINIKPVYQVYASNGKLWRVNVSTSSGAPGSPSNPPVQISSETTTTQACLFEYVLDVTSPNAQRIFYNCGTTGLKTVTLGDGPTVAPVSLPGLNIVPPLHQRYLYDLSTGIATHMFAHNGTTLSIIDLSTLSVTSIQANIADITVIAQDTSDRVFLASNSTQTVYLYTRSTNTLVPLITGVASNGINASDGTNFFVANGTAGIVYKIPLTATAATDVVTILNLGGTIYNYATTTNRVYVTAPVSGGGGTQLVSVSKAGGTVRQEVPAAGNVISPILASSNGLFFYTSYVPSGTVPNGVTSSVTVAMSDSGTPAATFNNTEQVGVINSHGPYNVRGITNALSRVLIASYVGGVLNGGTMTSVDATTGAVVATLGTFPSTPSNLANVAYANDKPDTAALGTMGAYSLGSQWLLFFVDAAIPNSLVQVPIGAGSWLPNP